MSLDRETLSLLRPAPAEPPEWTRLEFHRCPNCPLDPAQHPHCPVAVSMVEMVEALKDRNSYDEVEVVVEAPSRTYSKRTPLQGAVSSLLGLLMTTSGCPILDRLRPMVETHLPFMTRHEALYRILTMYLLAQYFIEARGEQGGDWSLEGLVRSMDDIHTVNVSFCKRLNSIPIKDASVNAVVILSTLGDFPSRRITQKDLARLARLFQRYVG